MRQKHDWRINGDERRYECWLFFQIRIIKVICLSVFFICQWLREVVREGAARELDAEISGMKLGKYPSPREDIIRSVSFEKRDIFHSEGRGGNDGERYKEVCRWRGKRLRNFCPLSLSQCHVLEVKEVCVEKGI